MGWTAAGVGTVGVVGKLVFEAAGACVGGGGAGGRPGVVFIDEVFDAAVARVGDFPFEDEFEVAEFAGGADVLEGGFLDEGMEATVVDGPATGRKSTAGDGDPAGGGMAVEESFPGLCAEGERSEEQRAARPGRKGHGSMRILPCPGRARYSEIMA